MKAQFELTIDEKTGNPKIAFRHYDKSTAIEQKVLRILLDKSKIYGIKIVNTGGYLSGNDSWENYEIIISQPATKEPNNK